MTERPEKDPPVEQPVEAPAAPAATAAATALSLEANPPVPRVAAVSEAPRAIDGGFSRPPEQLAFAAGMSGGEGSALRAPTLRPLADTAKAHLPKVHILDGETVRGAAKQIGESLSRTTLGFSTPDAEAVLTTLKHLSDGERAQLEATYKKETGSDLRKHLHEKLSGSDFQRAIGLLDQRQGRTDDAANLKGALDESNPKTRELKLRQIYQTLNGDQIQNMHAQFEARHGTPVDEALRGAGLTERTQKAIDTYRRAAQEGRPVSAAERVELAQLGARAGDRDLIIQSVTGNSPEAIAAREKLKGDRSFETDLSRRFLSGEPATADRSGSVVDRLGRRDPVLRDYLESGIPTLKSITEANSGYFFGNKENTDLAVKHASADERRQFREGYDLSQRQPPPDRSSLSPEQRQSLGFYEQLQAAFNKGGNRGDALRWQDVLLNGRETVVSSLAKTEKDGLVWGSSHTTNDALNAARLNERDWRVWRNAEHGGTDAERAEGRAFRQQVEQAVRQFASSPEEAKRLLAQIGEQGAKDTYEAAQKVGRGLDATLGDIAGGGKQITRESLRAVVQMTPEQARQYREDAQVRGAVDARIKDLPPDARAFAEKLLKQVGESGQPPKLEGLDKIQYSSLSGTHLSVAEVQQLIRDNPDLAKRLARPESQQTDEERAANRTLDNALLNALGSRQVSERPVLLQEPIVLDHHTERQNVQNLRRQLLENGGQLTLLQQYRLNVPLNDIYKNIAKAPEAERTRFIEQLTPERQQLAKTIAGQNGELTLADRARSFAIEGTDGAKLRADLAAASPGELEQARSEYAKKYGGDLAASVIGKASEAEKPGLQAALNPNSDPRQALYDNYSRHLRERGGITFDGTKLTAERAAQLNQQAHEAYNKAREGLSPAQLKELDEFFGKALNQHAESRDKHTQILLDAAITAATLAAGSPLSVARIAAQVAAGGIADVAVMSLARGEFKPEKFGEDFLAGGASAFAGRATREGAERVAGAVPGRVAKEGGEPVVGAVPGKDKALRAAAPESAAGRVELPAGWPARLAEGGKELPPVPPGHTRLYRGVQVQNGVEREFAAPLTAAEQKRYDEIVRLNLEGKLEYKTAPKELQDEWRKLQERAGNPNAKFYTDELKLARDIAGPDGHVLYVDIPHGDIFSYKIPNAGFGGTFQVPVDIHRGSAGLVPRSTPTEQLTSPTLPRAAREPGVEPTRPLPAEVTQLAVPPPVVPAPGIGHNSGSAGGLRPNVIGASAAFADQVQRQLDALPVELRQLIVQHKYTVSVVGTVRDYSTDQAWLTQAARGLPGKTHEDIRGGFVRNKDIVFVERAATTGEVVSDVFIPRLVAHEFGHAIDRAGLESVLKRPEFAANAARYQKAGIERISDLPEFGRALYKDLEHLSKVLPTLSPDERAAALKRLDYFLSDRGYVLSKLGIDNVGTHKFAPLAPHERHPNGLPIAPQRRHANGRDEAFADLHHGLQNGDEQLLKLLPNSAQFVREHVLGWPAADKFAETISVAGWQANGFKIAGKHQNLTFLESPDKSSFARFVDGRLASLKTGAGEYEFSYDAAGKLTRIAEGQVGQAYEMINGVWHRTSPGAAPERVTPVIVLSDGKIRLLPR